MEVIFILRKHKPGKKLCEEKLKDQESEEEEEL
jgi:hypothetical protein